MLLAVLFLVEQAAVLELSAVPFLAELAVALAAVLALAALAAVPVLAVLAGALLLAVLLPAVHPLLALRTLYKI